MRDDQKQKLNERKQNTKVQELVKTSKTLEDVVNSVFAERLASIKKEKEQQRAIPCIKCKEVGVRQVVKILPNGTLWKVDHGNGRVCEWMGYNSFENMQVALRKELAKKERANVNA